MNNLQLIQPYINTHDNIILVNNEEIKKPHHIRCYELATTNNAAINLTFIASPYVDWLICYNDSTFFTGAAEFIGVGPSTELFSMDLPHYDHIFGVRFDDDSIFVEPDAVNTSHVKLVDNIFHYFPRGNTYEHNLISNFRKADSFSQKCKIFLSYLQNSKILLESGSSGNAVKKAIKEADYDETVSKIATDLDFTPRYLSRLFKDSFGYSPKDYMKYLRIQAVLSDMHGSPHKTNIELSKKYGYNDSAHFLRDFREFLGTTPKNYIQLMNLNDKSK